ncbi:MFS transporter [Micromonospora sp. DR5-3]|uniref:MFS transporter n=1 Tax=unclassified Micromonospora TaxID=2617518 RepID=UPI0011D476DE|nr:MULTISPECIES: MFS transporter [unclassified Micromonospora]MCW3819092.1 MFS transporter [Micromonospora sp. DR5-3]TYC20361.1 MFS transporter [Micromonospora sp. MP36]
MFRALRHPPFRMLWAVVILGQLGYWISSVAFQWEVAHRTGNDPLALGLLYFCSFAPYLLFSLPAGMLTDSMDRRSLMVSVQAAASLLAVAATLLATLAVMSTPAVMVLSFLAGCVITIVSPASQALIAAVVPDEDLASAVPLQSAGLNLARITGPALVGPVLLIGGPASAFGVYAVLSLGAAALAGRLGAGGPAARPVRAASGESARRRLAAAFHHVRARHPALPALGIVAATSVFGSAYLAQLPLIAARVGGDSESTFPTLVTLGGIGSLIGVLSVAWRGRGLSPVPAAVQLVVLGVVMALFGVVPSFPLLTVLMILGGGLTLSIMTSINSILQHLVDDAQRGRVMSLYFVCWGGLLPFGGLGLGGLVRLVGAGWAFAGYGVVASLAGLALALGARRTRA